MTGPFDDAGTDRRLINQYAASPLVIALIKGLVDEGRVEIRQSLDALKLRLSIDDMEGVNLDRIGVIVGQPRPFTNADENDLFAFAGGTGLGFSGIGRDDLGGELTGLDPIAGARVSDERYRRILRARILVNNGGATLEEMLFFIEFTFETWATISNAVGTIGLTIGQRLGQQDIALLLDLFPVAAGVRLDYIASPLPGGEAFAFAGGLGAGFAGLGPALSTGEPDEAVADDEAILLLDSITDDAGGFVGLQEAF